ncbi:MAG: hypothetical protein ACU0CO_07935 [Shimia sp.]
MLTDTIHETRRIGAPPTRVLALLTDSALRETWNGPGEGMVVTVLTPADAAPGARETARVTAAGEPDTIVHTDWTSVTDDLVANAETLEVEGAPIAAAFACMTLAAAEGGTDLTAHVTLHSFAGPEMLESYRAGWDAALAALEGAV